MKCAACKTRGAQSIVPGKKSSLCRKCFVAAKFPKPSRKIVIPCRCQECKRVLAVTEAMVPSWQIVIETTSICPECSSRKYGDEIAVTVYRRHIIRAVVSYLTKVHRPA